MNCFQRLHLWYARQREYLRAAWTINGVFAISCFGDRLWCYAIGYFIADVGGMTWVALGQLFESALKAICLPVVGGVLDRTRRHVGMQTILAINNLSIAASAILFFTPLDNVFGDSQRNMYILFVALLLNAISRVASEAQKQATTKDWIVALVNDSEEGTLSTHNAWNNGIDNVAACFAPLLCAAAFALIGKPYSALLFALWNLLSWVIEAAVVRHVYNRTPALRRKDEEPRSIDAEDSFNCCMLFASSFPVYWRQSCRRPMIALAILYFTVLGFDNIGIAFGNGQNVSFLMMSAFRSGGAALGFAGGWSYKLLSKCKYTTVFIGLLGLILQNLFLNLTTVSIWLDGNQFDVQGYARNFTVQSWGSTALSQIIDAKEKEVADVKDFLWVLDNSPSLLFFFIGIASARFGLWMADSAILEIMQVQVKESERYRVSLAQTSLQEYLSLAKDLVVIAFPLVCTFGALIVMSVTSVFIGLLVYASHFFTEGHQIRLERLPSERADIEMVPRLELKVREAGVHTELED